jgi:anti-anti-sigma factor
VSVDDYRMKVRSDQGGAVIEVVLSGEVDLSNADELQKQLERALEGSTVATVDLREVTYIDSRGIRLLVQVARVYRQRGGRFKVVAPKGTIAGGTLRLSQVDELEFDDAVGRDSPAFD